MWSIRVFAVRKEIEFLLDPFSRDSSEELNCSTMLLCHKNDISSESNTVVEIGHKAAQLSLS